MAGKQVRCLCCPAAVWGARPKMSLGETGKAGNARRTEPENPLWSFIVLLRRKGGRVRCCAFLRGVLSRSLPQGTGRHFLFLIL